MKKLYSLLDKKLSYFAMFIAILMLISMTLEVFSIALIIPAVSFFFDDTVIEKFPKIFEFLATFSPANYFLLTNEFSVFKKAVIGGLTFLLIIFLVKTIFLIYFNFAQHQFVNKLRVYLSSKLLSGYLRQQYNFHLSHNSSELMRNILTEVSNIVGCSFVVIQMISEMFVLLGFSIFLMYNYFVPSISVIISLGLLAYIFFTYSKKKINEIRIERLASEEKRIRFIQEGLSGIKIIKVLGLEKFFHDKFMISEKLQSMITLKYNLFISLPRLLFEIIIATSLIIFLLTFILRGYAQQEIIAGVSVFLLAAFRLMPSINKLLIGFQSLKFNSETINKIYLEFQNIKLNDETIRDVKETNSEKIKFENEILIENISLNFPNREKILNEINFKINKNEFIAITGPTGSGKSSLIDIIIGLVEPTSGQILIDHKNLNLNVNSWQRQIGYVPQSLHFLDDTLRNNIAYGIPEEKIDDEQINYCLESSQLKQFVKNLNKGLDSTIGEDAMRISGGERKRIGIARALYSKPSVLILDEPTNELDVETEKRIINLLIKLKSKITIILISHKESSVKYCDKIYKIENKRINLIKKN